MRAVRGACDPSMARSSAGAPISRSCRGSRLVCRMSMDRMARPALDPRRVRYSHAIPFPFESSPKWSYPITRKGPVT